MQLMLKITEKCQFKCDFCSTKTTDICDIFEVSDDLVKIIDFFNADNLIISGGDPLVAPVKFYEDLLKIRDDISLSLTTNMWDFYENPDKWKNLLVNPKVHITTSFLYGIRRKKPDFTPYTEEDLIKVFRKFKDITGYVPMFISVISNENERFAIDHVKLAKRLGTVCKLINMIPYGLSKDFYPRYKMIDIYCKIIDLGLEKYEYNTLTRKNPKCPYNTDNCCNSLRCVFKKKDGFYLTVCSDMTEFNKYARKLDLNNILNFTVDPYQFDIVSSKCLTCLLCRFCNSCIINRANSRQCDGYCLNMSKYILKIKDYQFKL